MSRIITMQPGAGKEQCDRTLAGSTATDFSTWATATAQKAQGIEVKYVDHDGTERRGYIPVFRQD